jgi:hypothetical protein
MEKPNRNRNLFDDDSDDAEDYQATAADAKPAAQSEPVPEAVSQPAASTAGETAQTDNILAEEGAGDYQPYQEE